MKDPSLEEFAIPFCILCGKNERERERRKEKRYPFPRIMGMVKWAFEGSFDYSFHGRFSTIE